MPQLSVELTSTCKKSSVARPNESKYTTTSFVTKSGAMLSITLTLAVHVEELPWMSEIVRITVSNLSASQKNLSGDTALLDIAQLSQLPPCKEFRGATAAYWSPETPV